MATLFRFISPLRIGGSFLSLPYRTHRSMRPWARSSGSAALAARVKFCSALARPQPANLLVCETRREYGSASATARLCAVSRLSHGLPRPPPPAAAREHRAPRSAAVPSVSMLCEAIMLCVRVVADPTSSENQVVTATIRMRDMGAALVDESIALRELPHGTGGVALAPAQLAPDGGVEPPVERPWRRNVAAVEASLLRYSKVIHRLLTPRADGDTSPDLSALLFPASPGRESRVSLIVGRLFRLIDLEIRISVAERLPSTQDLPRRILTVDSLPPSQWMSTLRRDCLLVVTDLCTGALANAGRWVASSLVSTHQPWRRAGCTPNPPEGLPPAWKGAVDSLLTALVVRLRSGLPPPVVAQRHALSVDSEGGQTTTILLEETPRDGGIAAPAFTRHAVNIIQSLGCLRWDRLRVVDELCGKLVAWHLLAPGTDHVPSSNQQQTVPAVVVRLLIALSNLPFSALTPAQRRERIQQRLAAKQTPKNDENEAAPEDATFSPDALFDDLNTEPAASATTSIPGDTTSGQPFAFSGVGRAIEVGVKALVARHTRRLRVRSTDNDANWGADASVLLELLYRFANKSGGVADFAGCRVALRVLVAAFVGGGIARPLPPMPKDLTSHTFRTATKLSEASADDVEVGGDAVSRFLALVHEAESAPHATIGGRTALIWKAPPSTVRKLAFVMAHYPGVATMQHTRALKARATLLRHQRPVDPLAGHEPSSPGGAALPSRAQREFDLIEKSLALLRRQMTSAQRRRRARGASREAGSQGQGDATNRAARREKQQVAFRDFLMKSATRFATVTMSRPDVFSTWPARVLRNLYTQPTRPADMSGFPTDAAADEGWYVIFVDGASVVSGAEVRRLLLPQTTATLQLALGKRDADRWRVIQPEKEAEGAAATATSPVNPNAY